MTWLLRLGSLLAAFFLLRWLWSWFWRGGWQRMFLYFFGRAQRPLTPGVRHGTIKRDPVCGTFVDIELSVQERADGETLHFCSERCRDAYRAGQPVPAQKVS